MDEDGEPILGERLGGICRAVDFDGLKRNKSNDICF